MANLPGNPHYAEAVTQMDVVEDMTIQEVIQAEATLAVAFEQRTANLISLAQLGILPVTADDLAEITGRLGSRVRVVQHRTDVGG